MKSNEPALRAVRAQVQFDIVAVGAEVAAAAARSARELRQHTALTKRCDGIVRELRRAVRRQRINPALLDAMGRLYQVERGALQETDSRLAAAAQREQQIRGVLVELRSRERALDRALQMERRKQSVRQHALECTRLDDSWLQHTWRTQ